MSRIENYNLDNLGYFQGVDQVNQINGKNLVPLSNVAFKSLSKIKSKFEYADKNTNDKMRLLIQTSQINLAQIDPNAKLAPCCCSCCCSCCKNIACCSN